MGFSVYKLSEIAKIKNGKKPPTSDYVSGDIPLFGSNGVIGNISVSNSKKDSIIIGRVGANAGSVMFSKELHWVSDNAISVEPDEKVINNYFLYYLLKSLKINQFTSGSAQPLINQGILNSFDLKIPERKKQNIISNILGSIDSKIQLNNQMIETLEEMTSTLFKRWFVDFEFPDENGNPYKSSGGKMVESELGEIPEGWEVTEIGNLMENFDRKRVPLSKLEREKRKGNFPYYGAASLMDFVDGYIFDGTYLLLGEDGTVATDKGFPILQYVTGKFWVNNHAHVLKGKENLGITTEWLKLWFSQTNVKSIITGAVQPKISQKNLNNLKVSKASYQILSEFDSCISTMYVQIINITKENNSLIELRDTLLPKLLSGELEV